ncbi:MAG: cupredoxin domain-containing protein [Myxococcales bacterium]
MSGDASKTAVAPPPGRSGAAALAPLLGLAVLGGAGFLVGSGHTAPQTREIHVVAHQYGYDPAVLHVNLGDTVKLTFTSLDVTHGFYLEGYDLDVTIRPLKPTVEVRRPSRPGEVELTKEVVFTADREGKFRYRCSHTCGYLHPFMLGELIVGPNRLLPTGIGMVLGLVLGGLLAFAFHGRGGPGSTAAPKGPVA